MKGADLCAYRSLKSKQAFQGFVLLTHKTATLLRTEILRLPNSVLSLLKKMYRFAGNGVCYK